MASSFMGRSGRVYLQGEALQRHREDPALSIYKAESGKDSFVFKRVSKPFFDLSLRLADELRDSNRLRLHIDYNREEGILIYPYFRGTLLTLIKDDPDLATAERRKILRHIGEAIQELHSKDWVHIDVKPDNILVNWTYNGEGNRVVTNAVLGDFDIAFKSENGEPRQTPYAVGNVMWRSIEGQTGSGVTKASDIFSFGLVCIYTLGGGEFLLLNDWQELAKRGIQPEQEIVTRHFSYFGSVTGGLLERVKDDNWRAALKSASSVAQKVVSEEPEMSFQWWGQDLGSNAQAMISGMTNPDPAARSTIDQVLKSPWWQEDI